MRGFTSRRARARAIVGTDGFLRLALLDAPIPGVTEGDLLVSVQQPVRLYSDS